MKYEFSLKLSIIIIILHGVITTKYDTKHKITKKLHNNSMLEQGQKVNNQVHDNHQDNINTPRITIYYSNKLFKNKKPSWLNNMTIIESILAREEVVPDNNDDNTSEESVERAPELILGDITVTTKLNNEMSAPNCGLRGKQFIVGGDKAPDGAHPWIAGVLVNGGFWCGAAIINEWWVITAAHSFIGIATDPETLSICIGSNDRTKGTVYKVSKVVSNKNYNINRMKSSDIALMKIKGPIKMSSTVSPICLPKQSFQNVKSKSVVAAGWGFLAFGRVYSPHDLQQVQLNILPNGECAQKYLAKHKLYKSQICTFNERKDACQGDSGGPLVEYIDGRATLVGIVSYGYTCADSYPGVYTKVSYFLNWIQNSIRENS